MLIALCRLCNPQELKKLSCLPGINEKAKEQWAAVLPTLTDTLLQVYTVRRA